MEGFNLNSLRDFIPKRLPRLPTWPASNDTDDLPGSVTAPQSDLPLDETSTEPALTIAEPMPISSGPKSNLDLLNECDNFPYYQSNPEAYYAHVDTYYALYVKDFPETPLGYILPSVSQVFKGLPHWQLNDRERTLTLTTGDTEAERSEAVAITCEALRATDHFRVLRGWRNELYPVYGPDREVLFSIERAASALFGIVTYGCHMTGYVRSKRPKSEAEVGGEAEELKIWVPRRAATKQTYGGMLDNTVAGGIATGENPFESMVRESAEEASLPEELVREKAKSVGTVTYFHIRDQRAGGETRLLQPECQYVYDLELPDSVVPKPSDEEVEGFELMSVEEVQVRLRGGEFKPNCALVILDFFVRHGILTAEEEGYVELVARLHRKLEFPTR
ncbi:hypothetical protein BAUCODRAFT_38776 [Baudoinia panamericana UAMH 10762]|uniref:Nudix hydrolase domain-containing protein n=1 Tax=Baudoinia panamericana (strain UAMH 10762) TaxID=717646 RepID=M2M4Y2_BAUPA|nr:uncharacterized protein BAUCODRAFT_38776 [Baudoinia panamericana UAMH 10762]EMC91671.1 hypothetical protein BAUCODRAFT_38776 [Baudoinia panamericana UAMH 10762]